MSGDKAENSLSNLLAALALGARSVNALPLSENDELDYQMAFPEYSNLCVETRDFLASVLNNALSKSGALNVEYSEDQDLEFDDPLLWENAAEACDVLSDQIDLYIQNYKQGREGLDVDQVATISRIADAAKSRAKNGMEQMLGSIVDMEKPQITYGFSDLIDNSRTEPFIPYVHPERPFMINPDEFELISQPGHGLEYRIPDTVVSLPDDIVAPDTHYLHPYEYEINNLEYSPFQLEVSNLNVGIHGTSGTLNNPGLSSIKGVWIDKETDLEILAKRIHDPKNDIREIAVDLEAHSFRSFAGFVCLMQLSLRRPTVDKGTLATHLHGKESLDDGFDFVIDTLALRRVLNKHLAPIFANPSIIKVMHGANSDIEWLQRDFSIFVVNLFDTGRASRILPFISSASLAYLLRKYAGVEADKKHQLSDWRQRPLPPDMLSYAVSDTLYLLDIYDMLRMELLAFEQKNSEISIRAVLDSSKKVCLIRYCKIPFRPGDYMKLISSKRGSNNAHLSHQNEVVLKMLFDWRDKVARYEDESLHYVCSNSGLLRIASICPTTINTLQSCINPLPPLVLRYSTEILSICKEVQMKDVDLPTSLLANSVAESSITTKFKTMQSLERTSRNIDSEENYVSSEDSESHIIIKTDVCNTEFSSSSYTPHSLELRNFSGRSEGRTKCVNGSGAAKAILTDVDEQSRIAELCALRIRGQLTSGNQNLLGIVRGDFVEDEVIDNTSMESVKELDDNNKEPDDKDDYVLPKSMKEIYQMSNRNRTRNKKNQVVFDATQPVAEAMTIEEAKRLLSQSGPDGGDYFQDSSKRQRRDSDESTDDFHRLKDEAEKNDINLMIQLGWVENREEALFMEKEQSKSLIDTSLDQLKDTAGSKLKASAESGEEVSVVNSSSNKHANKRDKRVAKQQNLTPFDYSTVGAIGVRGTTGSDNPFFAGAALSGLPSKPVALSKDKKKLGRQALRKGAKKVVPPEATQSTFVYRK